MRQLVQPGPHAVYARVKRVESNPLYQGMASSADVALVELETPVTFTSHILPVCMPDPSVVFEAGMNCWVTGWGSPSEEGNGAELGGKGGHSADSGTCGSLLRWAEGVREGVSKLSRSHGEWGEGARKSPGPRGPG